MKNKIKEITDKIVGKFLRNIPQPLEDWIVDNQWNAKTGMAYVCLIAILILVFLGFKYLAYSICLVVGVWAVYTIVTNPVKTAIKEQEKLEKLKAKIKK